MPLIFRIELSGARALAAALAGQRAQLGELQRRQVDLQLGHLAAEERLLEQRAAVVDRSVSAIVAQLLQAALGAGHAGDAAALVRRAAPWRRSSPCSLAKIRFSTGTLTLSRKTSLTSWPPSRVMIGRTVMPGRLHVDQQEADARLRLGVGIGADQEEAPVGVLGQRRPGLLAVDDVVFLAVVARDPLGLVFSEARSEPAPGSE